MVASKILIKAFSANWVEKWDVVEKRQQLTSQSLDVDLMVRNDDGRHTIITNKVFCRSTSKMFVHCTEHQDAFFYKNTCCD